MKIFSRAKIPIDEAGSMSSRRTYTTQPSDSAPQIGTFPPPTSSNIASTFPRQASNLAGANDSGQPINFGAMPPSTHSSSQGSRLQPETGPSYNISTSVVGRPYISHPAAPLAFSGAGSSPNLASPIYDHPPVLVTPSSLSLFPEKRLQPGINVYEPRPSTAPAVGSWQQVLPPKRDLPFRKPTSRTKSNAISSSQEQIGMASGVREIGSIETALAPAQASDKSPVAEIVEPQTTAAGTEVSKSTTTTKTKKRAPAKNPPKTPAAKKPRTSAARKKSTAVKATKESPVSVEDIPKQSQTISSQADGVYASIDTLELPSRPDQCRTPASSQHPATSRTLKLCNANPNPAGSYNSHTSPSPLALLLRDPNFAPTPVLDGSTSAPSMDQDSTSFWALSEAQKVEAIDAFAVGEINSPRFEKLCVVMEGVWTKWMVL
jgi:hypothetical protein